MTTNEETETTETRRFRDMGLGDEVLRAIEDMGWDEPTPVQWESYPLAAEGKDLIVQARTGTGKTGAFGIPLVDRLVDSNPGAQALVLAPTRELALQSAREIAKIAEHKDIQTTAVYGGAPMQKQIRELAQGAQIVSGTPGRVLDHLRRGTLDPSTLKVLVLDEADEMLSMGFAKELNAIIELLPEDRQTLLFSATVDGPVQRVAERHMKEDTEFVELSGDAVGALGITHYIYMVSGKARAKDLIKILEVEDPESAIVFCNTKRETEEVAGALQQAGFNADWLNGDLPQSEREKIMARTRAEKLRFLVATDVAARGINVSHLTHVINYSLPQHLEQYVHRTGRTGRAGRTGTAISLVSPQELGQLYYLRLQYKIEPIERSMPTEGEEQTRREMDRVEMLEAAFKAPAAIDRAVAKRLLTHADAERLVAGLLGAFFGTQGEEDEVDEVAAAARRERAPEFPEVEETREDDDEEEERPRRKRRKRRKKREDRDERRARRDERDDADDDDRGRRSERDDRDDEDDDDRGRRGRSERDDRDDDEDDDEAEKRLFVNVGRKDDVRVGDLNDLFQDEGGLDRDEVGRIRVRDKHSFVSVPAEKADELCEKLSGLEFHDRELRVEIARNG